MFGHKLRQYEFLERLGAGGMGEVYRARDSALMRDVAMKILPASFARDPERMSRFRREAQLLASLNHPNIAAAYGLESDGTVTALIMELVPGRSLVDLIASRELGVREALSICGQIAEAVEAAHAAGVIHRDLKPANVQMTPEGTIKVLDFGLAKMVEGALQAAADSPTMVADATQAGVVLGSPAYMSPEQARGLPVDERTDIWALGCVLYETLAGRPPFVGPTVTDLLASTIHDDPDWTLLPAQTPAPVRDLLRYCLEKDAKRRLHDMADVRIILGHALEDSASAPALTPVPARRRRTVILAGVAAAAIAAMGSAAWSLSRVSPAPNPPLAVPILPEGQLEVGYLPAASLSADGTTLVYASTTGGRTLLHHRKLEGFETTSVAGSDGASGPFISPDGKYAAFFADGQLKKVSLETGLVAVICDAPLGRGGTWMPDGTLVFAATNRSGLTRVSQAGGTPQPLTSLDETKGERSHRLPHALPGGRAVLFTVEVSGALFDAARVEAVALDTGERHPVLEGGYGAHYSPSGHMVFARGGELFAVRFDPRRLRTAGESIRLPEMVLQNAVTGAMHFFVGADGSAVYTPSTEQFPDDTLVWVDRAGEARPATDTRRPFYAPAISPDGQQVAVTAVDRVNRDIWLLNLLRGAMTRLTFEAAVDSFPIWTHDGSRITFSSSSGGARNLFWTPADGSSAAERLTTSPNTQLPGSWTPDGRALVFEEADPTTGFDLWVLPVDDGVPGKPRPLLQTMFTETSPRLSPDGAWLAYVSDESGRPEVFVRAFPGPSGRTQISTDGGTQPVWAPRGGELFFRQGDRLFAVPVVTTPTFRTGRPQLLFARDYESGPGSANYDVSPDGKQFLMVQGSDSVMVAPQLNVVLHWAENLRSQ